MPTYIPKWSFCGCDRHPALPEYSDVAKDALCPPCRISVCIDHLDWLNEQFKKRGGIFESKTGDGKDHQHLKKDWVKTRVARAKLVSQYESLVEAEEKWNEERGAELNDTQRDCGVIAALAKWREYEEKMLSVAGVRSEEEPGRCSDECNNAEQTEPQHSIIFPQFRPNSTGSLVTSTRRNSAISVRSSASSSSKSSLKSALKSGTNSPTPSSKHFRIDETVTISPEHLNHTHFEAPMLSRSPTHRPHHKHVDAEHKKHRTSIMRLTLNGLTESRWASPENHEKVNTSCWKVQWDDVEDRERKADLYHKISGVWILLWYLVRVWEMLGWEKLVKEFKKRIGDPMTWGQEGEKNDDKEEDGHANDGKADEEDPSSNDSVH